MIYRVILPALLALLALTACTANTLSNLPTRADPLATVLPPLKSFDSAAPSAPPHANADLARDFLALTFKMESGKPIPRMSRFDGPVTLALAKDQSALFKADLAQLLKRLRAEARIDIRQIETGHKANITIRTLPQRELHRIVPQAACFVVPGDRTWKEFRKERHGGKLDWAVLNERTHATAFIPDDVSPQEARDCLNEEIAQALGPLNDIYRLPDSVFNDDNLNAILTPFDMLILKTYYSPELRSGMSPPEVARALPHILQRLNPAGEHRVRDGISETSRGWIGAMKPALSPKGSVIHRLSQAKQALKIAKQNGWKDNRLGFSLFVVGRLSTKSNPELATNSFLRAYDVYSALYGKEDIHTAHVALQLAALSLSLGHPTKALDYINSSLSVAHRAQNASLLATLLLIKAEALDYLGKNTQAATVRQDGLGWAQYGFASDNEIRVRLREIAALRPHSKRGV